MASFNANILGDDALKHGLAGGITWGATISPDFIPLDIVPPVVTLVSPSAGAALSRQQSIVFSVTDDGVLGYHAIFAWYRDVLGLYEVVWDGDPNNLNKRGQYTVSRVPITKGWLYTVNRMTGWLSRPTIVVRATDYGSGEI